MKVVRRKVYYHIEYCVLPNTTNWYCYQSSGVKGFLDHQLKELRKASRRLSPPSRAYRMVRVITVETKIVLKK